MSNKIKNVLITGGTRGLGLEYARFLASRGYNIGITDISETACQVYGEAKSVQDILDELVSHGIDAWYQSANLIDPAQADQLLTSYLDYFGEIHAVLSRSIAYFLFGLFW